MIREQPSSKDKLSVSPSTSQIKMTAPSSTNPPVPNSPSQGRVAIAVQTTEEKLKNSPPSPVAPVRSVVPRENSQGSKLTFKGAAKAVIHSGSLIPRKRSTLFQSVIKESTETFEPVQRTYMTWLDVEKKLEDEYQNIQEKSFTIMMKQKFVSGEGERAARTVGVNPFDDNRVILSRLDSSHESSTNSDSTFINASYIDGKREREYIAAAMPHNPTTRNDFWRMIYEQHVVLIVMLNDENEQGNEAYWPKEKEKTTAYGSIAVTLTNMRKLNNNSDSVVRYFLLKGPDGVARKVLQSQYREWPDMGIPQEKSEFLTWFTETDSLYDDFSTGDSRMVVHCFGGVGRTGTFMMVHMTLQKMKRLGGRALEIEKILGMMRHKRANMVQTAEQYKFCYRMLLELYEKKRSLVSVLGVLKPKD